MPSSPTRRFDVVFFMRGHPPDLTVYDESLFIRTVDAQDAQQLMQSTQGCFGVDFFARPDALGCFAVRLEDDTPRAALAFTRHLADTFVDALSVGNFGPLPKIGPLALLLDSSEEHASWIHYSPTSRVRLSPKSPQSDLSKASLKLIVPALNIASNIGPNCDSPLARQLSQALRMYRHGATADSFGVEFLCKFSALECLVCTQPGGKRALLTTLLPSLFRADPLVTSMAIDRIWRDRNAAVHESAGFYSRHAPGTRAVQMHLQEIDFLFRGGAVFAAANLHGSTTVVELWTKVQAYSLPDWALDRNTAVLELKPHELVISTEVVAPWGRAWFNEYLRRSRMECEGS